MDPPQKPTRFTDAENEMAASSTDSETALKKQPVDDEHSAVVTIATEVAPAPSSAKFDGASILPPPQPVGVAYEFEGVPVIRASLHAVPTGAQCCLCKGSACPADVNDTLFRPCNCDKGDRYFHRTCFRSWRQGWINPRNYFCCPDCRTPFRIERVKAGGSIRSESRERIIQHFRVKMATFYLTMLLVILALIAGVAGIAWAADQDEKNVPVAVKFMMTSVVGGFPNENSTTQWREDFRNPHTPVWPYYTLLGLLCTAVFILLIFAQLGCTFDENERPRRTCTEQCCGQYRSYRRPDDPVVYSYWGCYNYNTPCDVCYCPCDRCCDHNCGNGPSGGCHCAGGDCGRCDAKGGGEIVLVLVAIVIVIILVSALIVTIVYAVKKWTLFHDRMTEMIECQAAELESETIVLGIDETLRPLDAV